VVGDLWTKIYSALNSELEKYDTVSICLEHLYPAFQANPHFLKGRDRILYDMLRDEYVIGVSPMTVTHTESLDYESFEEITTLTFRELHLRQVLIGDNAPKLLNESERNLLVVPRALDNYTNLRSHLIGEYTGNEAEGEANVYLLAALVVRKKITEASNTKT
jgi:hypothetical protein